ncbi:MAG: hypothetical protein GYB37_13080 [Algicola sp.]|nr:hypothetical protein [Algicola sp.]
MTRRTRNTIAILFFIVFGIYLAKRYTEPVPFDAQKWKTQSESEMTWRWDMMESLQKEHQLEGMTREEIIHLLGEPSQSPDSRFIYDLGPSGRGINYGYLELNFNKKGKVTSFVVGDH